MAVASNKDHQANRRGSRPRIAVITYDVPHKKTQEVLFRLIWRDCCDLTLVVTSFKSRSPREVLFSHRPAQPTGPGPLSLARKFGLNTLSIEDWRSYRANFDFFLVGGSGLIDPEFCQSAKIVNCHPGLIPLSRGLDAFKWAIYDDLSVGNTLHFIDAERHYTAEIHLLSNFDSYLQRGTILNLAVGDPRKRMPPETEALLMRGFDAYKEKHGARLEEAGHHSPP